MRSETQRLIASNKVEGTPVYKRDGEQLGNVYNFMVDKYSGQVAYAVMSFGGFLGLRNVSTTLRQPAFEFKLGFPAFGLAG